MRKLLLVLCLALSAAAPAQARAFEQPELDALLAPVALYPDELVNHILVAAAYPEQVADAARGTPAQPHWHPSVSALASYPELLERMAESPQWMRDLSQAFIHQQASVMVTVQALRARAQANGHLPGPQPATQVVYVRHYDPLLVYGPWWWPAYRPVLWRPWHSHRVFVPHHHHHRRHAIAPRHLHAKPDFHGHAKRELRAPVSRPHVRVPEAQRRPIVNSTPQISHRQFHGPSFHRQAPRGGGVHHKPR